MVFLMQAYICDAAASPLAMNNDMIVGRWASTPTGQQTGTLLVLLPTLDFWALFYFYRCSGSYVELSRFDNFKDFLGYGT